MNMYKDPDAVLDYTVDWQSHEDGPWLDTGETISSHTVAVPDGITKVSDNHTDTKVIVWLSEGVVGTTYPVTFHIVTNQGRQDDRTIRVAVRER